MFSINKEIKTTKLLLKAVSLLLIANVDGMIAKEEAVYLSIMLGKNTKIIFLADKYTKQNAIHLEYDNLIKFILQVKEELMLDEVYSLIINMIDLMYIDGDINKEQEKLIDLFVDTCEVDVDKYQDFRQLIQLKFMLSKNS